MYRLILNKHLDKKLFTDDFQTKIYKKTGHPCAADFVEFGKRIGVNEKRIEKLLQPFLKKQEMIEILIRHSFLNTKCKKAYQLHYNTRRNNLVVEF